MTLNNVAMQIAEMLTDEQIARNIHTLEETKPIWQYHGMWDATQESVLDCLYEMQYQREEQAALEQAWKDYEQPGLS